MAYTRYCFQRIRGGGSSCYLQTSNILKIKNKDFSTIEQTSSQSQKIEWKKAVSDAEKIVDNTNLISSVLFPENFINNMDFLQKKFIGSKHPILSIAKKLLFTDKNIMQNWSLISLLLSRTAGHVGEMNKDKTAKISNKQRDVARITELIRVGYLLHRGLFNIELGVFMEPSLKDDMVFGNKAVLLFGDYFFANASKTMAEARNNKIVELMSIGLKELLENEFIGRRDKQNMPLPAPSDNQDWEKRNTGPAILLGNACLLDVMLAGHNEDIQQQGYKFGKHYALAWQSRLDLLPFLESKYVQGTTFDLASAPVLFHLSQDPSLFTEIEKGVESVKNVDFEEVHKRVSIGPGIGLAKELYEEHSQKATEVLEHFEESEANTALRNLIRAMAHL